MTHSKEDILKAFEDVNLGKVTNYSFSHANVVMLTKEYFAALLDQIDTTKNVHEDEWDMRAGLEDTKR